MSRNCCSGPHGHSHTPSRGHVPAATETAIDPVCGMTVKIESARHTAVHDGHTYYFCNPECLAKFTAEPARYLKPAEGPPAVPVKPGAIYTCPMHPGDPPGRPGQLPDLRHGAGAGGGDCRGRPQSGTRRHDASVLDRAGRCPCRFWRWRWAVISTNLHMLVGAKTFKLDPVRAGDAGRAVGGLAVLRARLAVAQDAQPQHVHPDRHGHRRRLGLQRRGDRGSRPFPARVPQLRRHGRSLFRGGGGDHRAGAARPGARTAGARADIGRHPRPARSRAQDRASH